MSTRVIGDNIEVLKNEPAPAQQVRVSTLNPGGLGKGEVLVSGGTQTENNQETSGTQTENNLTSIGVQIDDNKQFDLAVSMAWTQLHEVNKLLANFKGPDRFWPRNALRSMVGAVMDTIDPYVTNKEIRD